MCTSCLPDVTDESTTPPATSGAPSRRSMLTGGIGAASALSLLAVQSATPAAAAVPAASSRRPNARTRAVVVGSAGGPIWRQADGRTGICTVVEVAGARYLIDAGHGSAGAMWATGLVGPQDGKNDLTAFRAGFLTHLHSDHVTDLATFLVQGFIAGGLGSTTNPFTIYGPGDRGQLPHVFPPGRPTPALFNPVEPTPGTASTVRQLLAAFATDINDRVFDATSPLIDTVIQGSDIVLPSAVLPNFDGPPPSMRPFVIHEDVLVTVSATLVDHGQMVPSYAYRFDSADGSIVISGDTTLTPNLLELADGCDVLLHEIIDFDTVNASISALPVPEPVKEAFRNHMFGSHTTQAQLAELLDQISVGTLVLHHLVPGTIDKGNWRRVANQLERGTKTKVVAAEDGMAIGI